MTYIAIALILTIGMVYMLRVRVGQLERRLDALERSAPIEDTETEIPDEPVSDQFPVISNVTHWGSGMP